MSRNLGMKMLTMTNLSTECLIQLTKLGYDATPFNQILKQNAKREVRLRLGKVTVSDVLAAQPVTTNLLKFIFFFKQKTAYEMNQIEEDETANRERLMSEFSADAPSAEFDKVIR